LTPILAQLDVNRNMMLIARRASRLAEIDQLQKNQRCRRDCSGPLCTADNTSAGRKTAARARCETRFTLIEVLVVVAIIALLVAVLHFAG
jgi:prepilin-type N-terminal cleavage/methylation domain-containing protein